MIDFSQTLLLIDKPEGISSFYVIRQLRRAYSTTHEGKKAPKLGHAGTLDPAASGLMLIGVGAGTKKLTDYIKLDKEYVADILLGRSTTSGDREGKVLEEVAVELTKELRSFVSSTITNFSGTHTLPVSAYSAIKKDGVPMYKRAREAAKIGELVNDVPIRNMIVHETELLDVFVARGSNNSASYTPVNWSMCHNQVIVKVRFVVGSGTYIRSLAEEIGRMLGLPASLRALRRTKVGEFDIGEAISI